MLSRTKWTKRSLADMMRAAREYPEWGDYRMVLAWPNWTWASLLLREFKDPVRLARRVASSW